ncbi:MAG: UDP-3-O-acyl-N-acetylglucosamine deacetylase [Myxococcaceae bacterium]
MLLPPRTRVTKKVVSWDQRTLERPVACEGVGLHSGAKVRLLLRPAAANSGLTFVRTDLERPVSIPALSAYVVDTALATSLARDGVRVGTVEHLLAALYGCGVDNARIELDGPEVPIMDGSAAPFAEMIFEAGLRTLEEPKRLLVVRRPVTVRDGDKEATLSPGRGLRIDCTIDFQHPLISDQALGIDVSDQVFAKDIARARTFGFLRDVERLKAAGLARGGSLDNAIVVDEFSILNPDGLRFPDEFVRHKALDALGDLALSGYPLVGHVRLRKSGHGLHHQLVQKLLADPTAYEVVAARPKEIERLNEASGRFEPLVA